MMVGITGVGGVMRFVRLQEPMRHVFDEAFYARDSCLYTTIAEAACWGNAHAEVHPPLGKWIISLGIRVFGYDAFGWRFMAAVAGTVSVALMYVLAKKIMRSTTAASLSAGLVAFDFLHFVQSRVAMLDIFASLFSIVSLVLLAEERTRMLHTDQSSRITTLRVGLGIACGAALASKWSGGLTLLACIWLLLAWSSSRQRGSSSFIRLGRALRRQGASLLITLILIPIVVYTISFIGTVDPEDGTLTATSWVKGFATKQVDMLNFHRHTVDTTIASSPPWSWPLIKRPVPFFVQKDEQVVEVWFGGNPLLWWPALLSLGYLGWRWTRNQDPEDPAGFIVGGFLLLYAPWLLLTIPPFTWARALVFIFYLLPALPFMYLALARVIQMLASRVRGWVAVVAAAVAVGSFAFFYPILAAQPISREAWLARVRWFDDCRRPPPGTLEFPDPDGSGRVTITLRSDNPPLGWCWK